MTRVLECASKKALEDLSARRHIGVSVPPLSTSFEQETTRKQKVGGGRIQPHCCPR